MIVVGTTVELLLLRTLIILIGVRLIPKIAHVVRLLTLIIVLVFVEICVIAAPTAASSATATAAAELIVTLKTLVLIAKVL